KLSLLKQLVCMVDILIPGGGIANTFLKAQGTEIGLSLYEPDLLDEARAILELAKQKGCIVPLPKDVVVGKSFSESCPAFNKSLHQLAKDDMILDIGPETITKYISYIGEANTIIWNGPVGVFEFAQFAYVPGPLLLLLQEAMRYQLLA